MSRLLLLTFSVALLLAALFGCARSQPELDPYEGKLPLLLSWMEGDFDNTRALADEERRAVEEHLPIEVHRRALPQLENALYVEQGVMTEEGRPYAPYRQQVFMFSGLGEGYYLAEVFLLRNEEELAGKFDDPEVLASISMDDLVSRGGCDVVLRFEGDKFTGGTIGKECESPLRGANYLTRSVEIYPDGFTSFDRGWNAEGELVWGARKLPYWFQRRR